MLELTSSYTFSVIDVFELNFPATLSTSQYIFLFLMYKSTSKVMVNSNTSVFMVLQEALSCLFLL